MAQDIAEQLRNQQIREWARTDGGWPDLADRGRLPAAVTAAYEAYQQATGGGDDGSSPDFAAAAAALGVSPLDSDDDLEAQPGDTGGGGSEPPPPEQQTAAAAAPADTAALPPVTSLDEARQRVAAGKAAPGWARPPGGGGKAATTGNQAGVGKRRRKPAPPPPPDTSVIEITPAVLDDMAGKLAMLITVPASWWETVDPTCGGAFAEHAPKILETMVPVMARSQAVVRLLTADALYFQLFAIAQAVAPVAKAIYGHHFSEQAQRDKQARARAAAEAQDSSEDLAAMYPSAPRVSGHVPAYRPAQARM